MIHQAARSLFIELRDEAEWKLLEERAGLTNEHFISAQSYDDDVTFALIGEIVRSLDVEPEVVLERLGRHWLKFADESAYASMLRMAGTDIETFLRNLDRMHASIKATMPSAVMPSFEVLPSSGEGGPLELRYSSPRTGLESFVSGLLAGLLERFGEAGTVSVRPRPGGAIFEIERTAPRAA